MTVKRYQISLNPQTADKLADLSVQVLGRRNLSGMLDLIGREYINRHRKRTWAEGRSAAGEVDAEQQVRTGIDLAADVERYKATLPEAVVQQVHDLATDTATTIPPTPSTRATENEGKVPLT